MTDLFKPEKAILDHIENDFKNKAILDVGIGTGRTTRHLLNISKNYIGIDYSHTMVCVARQAFPGVRLLQMDARDLSKFANGQFDLIWFSFNGIDCACHDDRLKILREIHRVLHNDGVFVFSAHNRDSNVLSACSLRNFRSRLSANPVKFARGLAVFLLSIYNYIKLKPMVLDSQEYSVKIDPSYAYSSLWYYISLDQQVSQLKREGFKNIVAVGLEGEVLQTSSPYTGNWIYYLSRK